MENEVMNNDKTVYVNADGSCGLSRYGLFYGGYAATLAYKNTTIVISDFKCSRNYNAINSTRMEMMAIIAGLEVIKKPSEVVIFSDTKFVIDSINDKSIYRWIENDWRNDSRKPIKNKDLWIKLLSHVDKHNIQFKWVKSHAGNKDHEYCDSLAKDAMNTSTRHYLLFKNNVLLQHTINGINVKVN